MVSFRLRSMIRRALLQLSRTPGERVTRPDASVISYYVTSLARVLRPKWQLPLFVLASVTHAVAHAFMALVAAAVAVTLARQWSGSGADGGHVVRGLLWVSEWSVGGKAPGLEAVVLSGLGLAAVFVKGVSGVYATYVQARIGGELATTLRLGILDTLLACRPAGTSRHGDHGEPSVTHTAQAVTALTLRVQDVEHGLGQGVLGGARAAAQLVPIAILLAALSPSMALAAVGTLAGFAWALGRMRAGYRRATGAVARENERLLDAADEAVRHADLWVAFGAEPMARWRVLALGLELAKGSAALHARGAAMSSVNEVLAATALVIALGAECVGWLGPAMDGGTLLFFAVVFFLAYRPLRELSDARLALVRASEAYRDLRRWSPAPSATPVSPSAELDPPTSTHWSAGVLEIRGLRARNGKARPVSLRVEPGTVVAIVGPTGIGKTSLLRVLLGLECPVEGAVIFDGVVLGEAPAGPGARPFAWVPQDAPLLADTLDANVQLGAPGVSVHEVLSSFGAPHLVEALGRARLGAGGRAVSGGERQWIALARAVATQLPVLLLDEPTSGLDSEAQRLVLAAIARLRGHRTVLLVTHRPEPLSIADVVVRLERDESLERAA
jgi:ABC-type multidrug transport system fused ATPase/permease subunit